MIPKTHKLIAAAAFAVSLTTISASAQILPPKPKTERVPIDLVVCLDTSGSMRGLLDSARQSIWSIVNDLALAEPAPLLRVALLTYGNNGHDKANGWVKLESGFTQDLDLISERLFSQTLNGGTELVGRVLRPRWSGSSGAPRPRRSSGSSSRATSLQIRTSSSASATSARRRSPRT
jgi:hypothetical protein